MEIINSIIRFSLKNRLTVFLGALLLIVGGILSWGRMDIDVFPDLTAPTVVVMSDAHGMAAEEVERLVTFPIETAVNGATNVRRVRSASMYGFSFVWAEFNWGTDVYRARQIVSEKMVALAGTLPNGITPVLAPQSSIMGEILLIGMQADSTSMMELRSLADWVIKPAILATGGVSQVTIIGGDYKQYQILADPQKMDAYGIRMSDLEHAGSTMSRNKAHMADNLHLFDFELTDEEMAQIAALDKGRSAFFSHQDLAIVEWFGQMVEERKKQGHHPASEKKAW